jgi:DNA-binding CsgD family transcriptional regulator
MDRAREHAVTAREEAAAFGGWMRRRDDIIRACIAEGLGDREIGDLMGIGHMTVYRLRTRS